MTSLRAPQATQENLFGNTEGARCDEVAGRFTATHLLQYRAKGHCGAMPTNRRFPPPWTIEDNDAAFVVKDGGRMTRLA